MIMSGGGPLVPLSTVSSGERFQVKKITGPDQQRLRLSELGFVVGADVEVVNRGNNGMLVVKLGGCRVALAGGMGGNVWVG